MAEFEYTLRIKTNLPAEQVQMLMESFAAVADGVLDEADAEITIIDKKLWFGCDC